MAGRTLLAHAVELFSSFGCQEIVVVLPPDLVERPDVHGLPSHVTLASGGMTRQESVASGLRCVESARIIVHDAARPLASLPLVERVTAALDGYDAAIPAVPLEDTLKEVTDDVVSSTVERTGLWRAQTPQAFEVGALRAAHERARRDGYTATDDAGLIERMGGKVRVVMGDPGNIKITHAGDFVVAEALLARRGS